MKNIIYIIILLSLFDSSVIQGNSTDNFKFDNKESMVGNDSTKSAVVAVLNGLEITLDNNTGSILSLNYPGLDKVLRSHSTEATMIDLAYPIKKFAPLRLASRYSRNVDITITDSQVIIEWDRLGASRDVFVQPGSVGAKVILSAEPDGRSIKMTAQIINKSQVDIPQVIFPDFEGLLPFAGVNNTLFKTGGSTIAPFNELRMDEGDLSMQFCRDNAYGAAKFNSGGKFTNMWIRWLDFGGLNGGISIFPKLWGWDKRATVRLHHSESEEKIRMLFVHDVTIKAGEKWESPEYILTPHLSGWAKGIEPFREWVHDNIKRKWPVPKHVREGLGYRTIWMSQGWPDDPRDVVWKFSDFPKLAEENLEHGLTEMVFWSWNEGFKLPLPPPNRNLGTEKEMADAIAKCKKSGVNVAPFISVVQAGEETAHKYGLTVPKTGGWPQHTEAVPRFQAPYIPLYRSVRAGPDNPIWKKEVLESCKHLVDIGIYSLSWDQFWSTKEGDMAAIATEIRDYAKKYDSESTFSGENQWNLEIDADYLDYTWNWNYDHYPDCQPFTSAFPSPRINCIVSQSALMVKRAFCDNLYLNVFPRKLNSVNGSDWIVNHPQLSEALKQCSKLRKQFLQYFTDGTLIGNCILSELCPDAFVSAYVLPDKVLMILVNQTSERKINFSCNLEPWLKSDSGKYTVKAYDGEGKLVKSLNIDDPAWRSAISSMNHLDIALFEFMPR